MRPPGGRKVRNAASVMKWPQPCRGSAAWADSIPPARCRIRPSRRTRNWRKSSSQGAKSWHIAWRTSGRVVTGPGISSNIAQDSHAEAEKSIHAAIVRCYVAVMNIPFVLPDWVPWWVPLVLIVPTLLYALAFVFMPFSVLGVKGRLDVIEARLDEIQQEIRHLALRLPAGRQELDFEDLCAPIRQVQRREDPLADRPPIPPAAQDLYDDDAPVERP